MIWFLPFLAISQALSPMCIICHSVSKLPTVFYASQFFLISVPLHMCLLQEFLVVFQTAAQAFPFDIFPFPISSPSFHGALGHTSITALCIVNYNSLFILIYSVTPWAPWCYRIDKYKEQAVCFSLYLDIVSLPVGLFIFLVFNQFGDIMFTVSL